MKEFGWQKNISDKMAAMRTLTFFQACFNKKGLCLFYDSAYRGDQLISQLLIEHFDTLSTQCIHIDIYRTNTYSKKVRARGNSLRVISLCDS